MARAKGARVYGSVVVPAGGRLSLETLMCHPEMFGLTTATPVQRAIYRASDGLPLGDLWQREDVRRAFGGAKPIDGHIPGTFGLFSAIRGGKSAAAAMRCIQATQECDLSKVGPSDIVSIPCLSVSKERAADVFKHLSYNVQTKPALRALLVGEIRAESLTLRHPSGHPIEIRVTAIAKHGASLVGRWLAGCIFDEAPRCVGEKDGVRNIEQSMAAIAGRMLPRSTIWLVGSPHAPFGPAYELSREHFGVSSSDTIVIHADGPSLNPVFWTPEACEKLKNSNPDAYQADCLARFLDAVGAMFSLSSVERAQKPGPADDRGGVIEAALPYEPRQTYVAAVDPASRGNTFALAVATNNGQKDQVILTRRWRPEPGMPLDLEAVWAEVAEVVRPYGIKAVRSDPWGADPMRPIARAVGLGIADEAWTSIEKSGFYERFRIRLERDLIDLPSDMVLSSDLMRCRKVPTYTGFRVDVPISADGSHGDTASAVVQALAYDIPPPKEKAPEKGTEEWYRAQTEADKKTLIEKATRASRKRFSAGGFKAMVGR